MLQPHGPSPVVPVAGGRGVWVPAGAHDRGAGLGPPPRGPLLRGNHVRWAPPSLPHALNDGPSASLRSRAALGGCLAPCRAAPGAVQANGQCLRVIGEPIKQSAKLIGEPIEGLVKTGTPQSTANGGPQLPSVSGLGRNLTGREPLRRAAGGCAEAGAWGARQRGDPLRSGAGAEGPGGLVPRPAAHPGRRPLTCVRLRHKTLQSPTSQV